MENWKGIRRVVGTLSRWRVKSVPVGHWGECPSIVGSGFRRADFGGTLGHGEMAGEKDREWQPRTSNAQRLKQRVAFVAEWPGEWDVPVNDQECRCTFGRIEARRWTQSVIACPGAKSGGAIAARLRTGREVRGTD